MRVAFIIILLLLAACSREAQYEKDRQETLQYLPDKCVATPPFSCIKGYVNGTRGFMQIENRAGVDLKALTFTASCGGVESGTPTTPTDVKNGDSYNWTFTCPKQPRGRLLGNFTLTYTDSMQRTSKGKFDFFTP